MDDVVGTLVDDAEPWGLELSVELVLAEVVSKLVVVLDGKLVVLLDGKLVDALPELS